MSMKESPITELDESPNTELEESPISTELEESDRTMSSRTSTGQNSYISKKTIAQGMFDVALLSSNTNQLVHLLESMSSSSGSSRNRFRLAAIVLLIISITLQVIVGCCLIVRAVTNPQNISRRKLARRLDHVTTLLIFMITVLNILIPPFTPSYHAPTLNEHEYTPHAITTHTPPSPPCENLMNETKN